MNPKQIQHLQRQIHQHTQQLAKIGPFMRGSVVVIGTRNKQPYFSLNKEGKTRLIYLGKQRVALARRYCANYQKLTRLVDEITLLNMTLLKNQAHFQLAMRCAPNTRP
jgi:hypothetical protein